MMDLPTFAKMLLELEINLSNNGDTCLACGGSTATSNFSDTLSAYLSDAQIQSLDKKIMSSRENPENPLGLDGLNSGDDNSFFHERTGLVRCIRARPFLELLVSVLQE